MMGATDRFEGCSHRTTLICALTTEFDRSYSLCNPEKENLCLYRWEVILHAEKVPPSHKASIVNLVLIEVNRSSI
jgi:hypothetical protein